MSNPYRPLEKTLGYRFRRKRHLEAALTHRSYRAEHPEALQDNQRLEFLGDAVLNVLSATRFYDLYPDFQEGELTRARSQLTNTRRLGEIAASIGLGLYLRAGRGEMLSGGIHRPSTICDTLEAIIGAAYVDGGLKAARKIFDRLFAPSVEVAARENHRHNPKGLLQELCQQRWKTGPQYRVAHAEGPSHARTFVIEVVVQGEVWGSGTGRSKQDAEMTAAAQALRRHFPDRG